MGVAARGVANPIVGSGNGHAYPRLPAKDPRIAPAY
jgi:hypothetical protein